MKIYKALPNGEKVEVTGQELADLQTAQADAVTPRIPTSADVSAETLRRIEAGFTFGGVVYDFDAKSQARITGAATLAGFAMGYGAAAGNYFWADPLQTFAWIAQDNSVNPMDAPTCFAFGQAGAAHESAHVFAAYALKMMDPIPADYATNAAYWP